MKADWYQITSEADWLTPALLIYPERVQQNIKAMLRIAGGPERLRPHVKTYKLPQIVGMQLEAGIRRFKCATLVELQMLAAAGVPDILMAYPLTGPAIQRFVQQSRRYPRQQFSAIVDSPDLLPVWQAAARAHSTTVSLMVDLEVGMGRTGISPEQALPLIEQIQEMQGLAFAGLHVYDGHQRESDPALRATNVAEAFAPVQKLLKELAEHDIAVGEIVCGGSPTFAIHAQDPQRTLSPGTTLLWDQGYGEQFPDLPFQPAAVLLTRVVSRPGGDHLCVDLGHKAIGSEMPHPRAYFPQLPQGREVKHSEEHLVLDPGENGEWPVGTALYAIPRHICPTVALHAEVAIVEDGDITGWWPVVARNRFYR